MPSSWSGVFLSLIDFSWRDLSMYLSLPLKSMELRNASLWSGLCMFSYLNSWGKVFNCTQNYNVLFYGIGYWVGFALQSGSTRGQTCVTLSKWWHLGCWERGQLVKILVFPNNTVRLWSQAKTQVLQGLTRSRPFALDFFEHPRNYRTPLLRCLKYSLHAHSMCWPCWFPPPSSRKEAPVLKQSSTPPHMHTSLWCWIIDVAMKNLKITPKHKEFRARQTGLGQSKQRLSVQIGPGMQSQRRKEGLANGNLKPLRSVLHSKSALGLAASKDVVFKIQTCFRTRLQPVN